MIRPTAPSSPGPDSMPARQNSIGLLRLALAALVVYSHAHLLGGFGAEPLYALSRETLIAGTFSVQAFFVLSGALVAQSWLRRPSLPIFVWHRALRLAPAFWVCLAFTAFVLTPLLHATTAHPPSSWGELLARSASYLGTNLFSPRHQIAIFPHPENIPWPGDWNGSLWTLFYEGAAYLMVAGLGLATLIGRNRRLGTALLLGLLALNTLWQIAPGLVPAPMPRLLDTAGKQLTLYFFAGIVWALNPSLEDFFGRRRLDPACFLVFGASVPMGLHPVLGPWLLAPVLFRLAAILPAREFERRIGGDYSYGLYLYGYPIQQSLSHFGAHHLGFPLYLALSFAFTLPLAILSWKFIERPALGWKKFAAPRKGISSVP